MLAVTAAGCSRGVPYTSIRDVAAFSDYRVIYQFSDTTRNGGCEDGNDCRAYAVLAPSSPAVATIVSVVAQLRRQHWKCAHPHTPRQAALINSDGRRFVEMEPAAALARELPDAQDYFDDMHGELVAVRQTATTNAVAVSLTHTSNPDKSDLDDTPSAAGLCR